MWLEIFLIPFLAVIILFIIFWIVHEGTRWQKHPHLGVFARIIQVSPKRSFFIFLVLTILTFPMAALVMLGLWWDKLEIGPEKTDVVNVMLLMFLVLAFTIAILWGSFRTWRHAARAEAEEKVRMAE
ncbi:hypothetical protein E4H12_02360 [Candidatus Thorarchaeota archaeon]|nr:hypothetical protein [Candidatus Thorarchaeota archaeon]TFG99525.1 MAG: hypothetical protein E4H12_02360 [Candidatus Thorarchaeota archaeon]